MGKYLSLEDILGKENEELQSLDMGEFTTRKLGTIPFTAISYAEYKQIKKDCIKAVPNGTGGMTREIDDDKLMLRVIVAAVDKDTRSTLTFKNKKLLEKLGVVTADEAVENLLDAGEVVLLASEIQDVSGFTEKTQQEEADAVKN